MTITELRNLYREKQLVEAIIEPSIQEGHGWWSSAMREVALFC